MKMADKYLHVQTNQLRPLIEHLYGKNAWEQESWERMGSTATAINLDDIDGGNSIQVDTNGDKVMEYHYLLPIINEVRANQFRVDCGKIGLEVEIMSHDDAIEKWKELKAIAKNQKDE